MKAYPDTSIHMSVVFSTWTCSATISAMCFQVLESAVLRDLLLRALGGDAMAVCRELHALIVSETRTTGSVSCA